MIGEIGAHVQRLWRSAPDYPFEVLTKLTADDVSIDIEIITPFDDPAKAIEYKRQWLLAFADRLKAAFGEPGSLE